MNKRSLLSLIEQNIKNNDISIDDVKKELDNYICPLTKNNVAIIEISIKDDPNYKDNTSIIIKNLGLYQNYSLSKTINSKLTKQILERFVWQIAIDNNIQGKSHSVKAQIAQYISQLGDKFYDRLKTCDWSLVEEMEAFVFKNNTRHECSWCSKVCKYLADYLFNGDNYYIYDSNVKNRLNDYRKKYGLKKTRKEDLEAKSNKNWYTNLCNSLDELNDELPVKLKRFELDHVLWGFSKYKVDLDRK